MLGFIRHWIFILMLLMATMTCFIQKDRIYREGQIEHLQEHMYFQKYITTTCICLIHFKHSLDWLQAGTKIIETTIPIY